MLKDGKGICMFKHGSGKLKRTLKYGDEKLNRALNLPARLIKDNRVVRLMVQCKCQRNIQNWTLMGHILA
jgi:hypothetical protein